MWRRPKRSDALSPRRLWSRRNNPQTRHVSVNYSTRDGCPNPVLLASCASRAKMTKQRSDSMSFATRWNQGAIEEAYERWQQDPASVDDTWRAFFEGFELAERSPAAAEVPTQLGI